MRATYAERMEAERKKADKAREEREAHQKAMDAIFGVPAACAFSSVCIWPNRMLPDPVRLPANSPDSRSRRVCVPCELLPLPALPDFLPLPPVWKETVVGQMAPFEGGKAAGALPPRPS